MKTNKNTRKRSFAAWWDYMRKHPNAAEQMQQWLYYGRKTVALRGDMHQQRVVYTIYKRFKNSTYKTISRANAKRVFDIVNKKQQEHKRKARAERAAQVEVRKITRTRKIVGGK